MTCLKKLIQRYALNLAFIIFLSFSCMQSCFADPISDFFTSSTTNALNAIRDNTYNILMQLKDVVVMAKSWIKQIDNANTIGNNQVNFATLANYYDNNNAQQINISKGLTQHFLLDSSEDKKLPPNSNELNYSVVMNELLDPTTEKADPQTIDRLTKNYIKYASGVELALTPVDPHWPREDKKKQYVSLYNTATAIFSYNSYLLSNLNKQQERDTVRKKLVNLASSSAWFKQVATEELGLVLRHLLMYNSQIYVTLDRQLKVQQQQLTAQAMTNTLLLLYGANQMAESIKASATPPPSTLQK